MSETPRYTGRDIIDWEPHLYATQWIDITYGCGHYEGKAIGDAIYPRCLLCYPPQPPPT